MFEPDPLYENVTMLYEPEWNGYVEGLTWDAWWVQNSYGPTYASLPFLTEPLTTFLQNAQDLWWDRQGDGTRADYNGYVAPDGSLCDCASPRMISFRQGDGAVNTHDWFMEATAAGIVLQGELLLISRDLTAIAHYLPKMERAADFIETRRDPKTGLYLAGIASNLLAPSFAGYLKPDGTRGMAYHAGLQVTYIAALDRLIELERLAGRGAQEAKYSKRRDQARQSLSKLVTPEGYFVNSIDPDGTKHGVFGAAKYGYFESSVNHDAVCFGVADDALANSIFNKMLSIPQLRPHGMIIANYPAYDDMYEPEHGFWIYGTWVNGGHWSTCGARWMMAAYRTGHPEVARESMEAILPFARQFRMDNPLTECGKGLYQPERPINLTYDAFGIPAAMVRGLFEYIYKADRLVLVPHLPATLTALVQHDPIRFGNKRIYLETRGTGPITAVTINGEPWSDFSATQVTLPFDKTPDVARVVMTLGNGGPAAPNKQPESLPIESRLAMVKDEPLRTRALRLASFAKQATAAGRGQTYEVQHALLAARAVAAIADRTALKAAGQLNPLPPPSMAAADDLYVTTAKKLCDGIEAQLNECKDRSNDRIPHNDRASSEDRSRISDTSR